MTTRTWFATLCFLAWISDAGAGSFRDPKQILEIIEKSKLRYEISKDSIASFDLRSVDKTPVAQADPNWIVVKDSRGESTLKKLVPSGCAAREDSAALEAYASQDYNAAAAGYRRSYECDRSYVKALTYLGNSFFSMGKMDSAVFWLRKAINANPDDYQARFFLSDAYLTQGKGESAYFEFVEAYLRNPNSENLRNYGKTVMKMNGKRMDESWPVFGFDVQRAKDGAKISLSEMFHLPLATCLAAWMVDPEFESLRKEDDQIQQSRYKNCLANQTVYVASLQSDGKSIDRISEKLVAIVDRKLLGVMIVWERLARSHPESIYLLAGDVKSQIHAYVAEALEIR